MWNVNSQRILNHDGSIPLDGSLINVNKNYERAEIEEQNIVYEIKLSKQAYGETMI